MNATPALVPVPTDAAVAAERSVADDLDEGDLVLRITGIVPAVDFHPFVVRTARRLRLRGWIRHDPSGALIRAVGYEGPLVHFVRAIRDDAPATARVRSLDTEPVTADLPPSGDRFVALVEDAIEMPRPPTTPPLEHVA